MYIHANPNIWGKYNYKLAFCGVKLSTKLVRYIIVPCKSPIKLRIFILIFIHIKLYELQNTIKQTIEHEQKHSIHTQTRAGSKNL